MTDSCTLRFFGYSSISSFHIDGLEIRVAQDPACPQRSEGDGTFRGLCGDVSSGPSDSWVSPDGEFLYQIYGNASKLLGYATRPDGSLEEVTSVAIAPAPRRDWRILIFRWRRAALISWSRESGAVPAAGLNWSKLQSGTGNPEVLRDVTATRAGWLAVSQTGYKANRRRRSQRTDDLLSDHSGRWSDGTIKGHFSGRYPIRVMFPRNGHSVMEEAVILIRQEALQAVTGLNAQLWRFLVHSGCDFTSGGEGLSGVG